MQVFQLAVSVIPTNIDESVIGKEMNVEQNSSIKGFELGVRIYTQGADNAQAKVVALIRKNERGALLAPGLAAMNSLGTANWKNRIFHLVSMVGDGAGGLPLGINGIKIPKRFHRMAQGDVWELIVANNGGSGLSTCGYAVYKWYR